MVLPIHSDSGAPESPVVVVSGLSKDYLFFERPYDRFMHRLFGRPAVTSHAALNEVSFSLRAGEVLGILGRNGSGKSTLLQVLSGILKPSKGACEVRGRVAALLELGAGFNPEFTGRENVYLNASILGLTKRQTDERLRAILEFADIGDFIDRPVRQYSSGMFVRLAFAVASSIEPDVLIVDEALAVGDIQFQTKCFRRFEEFVDSGRTVILVSHSTEQVVRHCTRAILLDHGRLVVDGSPRDVANQYLDLMLGSSSRVVPVVRTEVQGALEEEAGHGFLESRAGYFRSEYRWGNGGAMLEDVCMRGAGEQMHRIRYDSREKLELILRANFEVPQERVIFGFFVKTPDGVTVFGNSTINPSVYEGEALAVEAGQTVRMCFEAELNLGTGSYILSVGISAERGGEIVPLDRRYDCLHFEVHNHAGAVGLADLNVRACRL